MSKPCRFSQVTKDYLCTFYEILDEMIRGMTNVELTDSISHNFIVQMIPHHRAVIAMAENILRYTTNVTLQDIASRIVREQTQSIEAMERIQCVCGEFLNSSQDLCLYQRQTDHSLHKMFSHMEHAIATNNVDCNFLREMIPHHRGAVEMSGNALQFTICPGLRPILHAIRTSQQHGIAEMQKLAQCIGCARS